MRYYLGQCEYKWSHVHTDMEKLWIRRELGDELCKTVDRNRWSWVVLRTHSALLPSDIYCRCDIYADSHDDKLDTHFVLKFPHVKTIERIA